jgi:hypothetical protein
MVRDEPGSDNPVSQALGLYFWYKHWAMSDNLLPPDRVAIQLTDTEKVPLAMAGVLFRVQLFARQKNDFRLQPFASDDRGLITISKKDIEAGVAANYDSGLMDYHDVDSCFPTVEISPLSQDDIDRAIEARKTHWTSLLAGERDRWSCSTSTELPAMGDSYPTSCLPSVTIGTRLEPNTRTILL